MASIQRQSPRTTGGDERAGWIVRWTAGSDHGDQRIQRSRYFKRYRDAQRWKAEVELTLEGRGMTPERGMTLGRFLERWCRRLEAHGELKPKTISSYWTVCNSFCAVVGDAKIDTLDPFTLEEALAVLARKGGRGSRPMAANTIRNHFRVLSKALSDAVRWKLIPSNPCLAVEKPKGRRVRAKAPTIEQARQLLTAAEGSRIYGPLYLALATGLRLGEILGLRWCDLDLKAGRLYVNQTAQTVNRETFLQAPKTENSQRSLAIGQDLCELLKRHRAEQARERLALGDLWQNLDLVFPNHGGVIWRPAHVSGLARQVGDLVGFPRDVAPFHGLRHAHASFLYAAQRDVKSVQARLGHSTPSITMALYVHVDEQRDKEAAGIASAFMEALKEDKS
ncbi:tyrosine-type recombinase/integrase [Limibacillus sp. MBR-115]|jgi:integrase|uniref:tyrosine-type recombinase/integrase n=1 Tax=Limibacillus sp. MBR-115 TaxID=3156465 RepID=UPI003398BB0F